MDSNDFAARIASINSFASRWKGYFLDQVSYSSLGPQDSFQVVLTPSGHYEPSTLLMGGLRFIRLEDPLSVRGSMVGGVELLYLPQVGKWPAEAQDLVGRNEDFPDLALVRISGMSEILAIAERVHVTRST